ncbi:MAG: hypothetical protein KJN68_02985 [Bacteroidia bacterium]|nr:hypothetical protein [Bacteroidia bacterium]NNK73532.1 hypothetical protein [Flavobacteriaceae bacterium]
MKRILLLVAFLTLMSIGHAQKTYTVEGESLELKTEISGSIDLLWNIIDGRYRYFVSKDGELTELLNTRGDDNKFKEEYKSTLNELTNNALSTDKLKLTLFGLKRYFNNYNKQVDPNFTARDDEAKLQGRLLLFGGMTNSPFIENPENVSNAQLGFEFEVFESKDRPRHSLLFQLRHTTDSDDFKYSNTQLALGYRFRFISKPGWSIYTTVIGATYNFSRRESVVDDQVFEESDSAFDAPVSFGFGTDIKIFKGGFLTISYDELFGLFAENSGNFSTNITAGVKFKL